VRFNRTFWITSIFIFGVGIFCQFFTAKVEATVWANAHNGHYLDIFFHFYTQVVEWPLLFISLGLLLYRDWFSGLIAGIFFAFEGILVNVLKRFFNAPRPIIENGTLFAAAGEVVHRHFSFPSGHTSAAFFGFGLLSCITQNRFMGILYAVLAALIGYSRMYLGQHYLKDVLAGESLGLLLLFTFVKLLPKIQNKFYK